MKRSMTTLLGFLVAPLVPVFVGVARAPPSKSADLGVFVVMGVIVYCYSCFLTALFGVPIYLLLDRKRLVRWWSAMLTGLFVGCLIAVLLRLPHPALIADFLVQAPTGALAGIVFWLIWSRGKGTVRSGGP